MKIYVRYEKLPPYLYDIEYLELMGTVFDMCKGSSETVTLIS